MNRVRNLTSVALLVAPLLGLLVACSSGGDGPLNPDEETADELKAAKTFKCGDEKQCDRKTQYCQITRGPGIVPAGQPAQSFTNYACEKVPSSCGSHPTCACLDGSGMCSGSASTGLTRTVMMM